MPGPLRLAGIGAYTLFATHYFELTALPDEIPGIANVHLDAVEHGERIIFMHAVKGGPASRSYGLQVAALAGVPERVLLQGRSILEGLEANPVQGIELGHRPEAQIDLFPPQHDHPLATALQGVDPDNLTPRQALELVYKLKEMAR